jgi:hypothetical protein
MVGVAFRVQEIEMKTKAIEKLENKMSDMSADSLRYRVLTSVKSFKTSWIDLGQSLYTVWKDKTYKEWGYSTFEVYTKKEIGIKKDTATKLLRSYFFLEKEEPLYLKKDYNNDAEAGSVPTYESVDLLRRARNRKDLDRDDYARVRKNVLDDGKDAREVKRDLTAIIKEREELEPEEAWRKKRSAMIKRLLSLLRSAYREIKISKAFSPQILADTEKLIKRLESEAGS